MVLRRLARFARLARYTPLSPTCDSVAKIDGRWRESHSAAATTATRLRCGHHATVMDWEFVTSVFKIRKKIAKFTKFLKFIKIRKNWFCRIISNCKVFEFAQQLAVDWDNRWMGTVGSDDRGLRFWHCGRQRSCRRFVDFVNKLLMIMLNCGRVKVLSCWHDRTFNPKVKCCVCDKEFVGTWRRWRW